MKVVLDANVLFASADESDPAGAERSRLLQRALAETSPLVVPTLAYYELGNVALNALEVTDPTARAAVVLGLLQNIGMEAPIAERAPRAQELAAQFSLTFYDASYLELADREPSTLLVTDDRRLLMAARRALGPERAFDTSDAFRRFVHPGGSS